MGSQTGKELGHISVSRGKSNNTQLIIYLLLKLLNTLYYSKFDWKKNEERNQFLKIHSCWNQISQPNWVQTKESCRAVCLQYMTTTESMYNSRIREKSFVKHFKKGACSGEETAASPVLQPWGLTSAAPQLESKCNTRARFQPIGFHAISMKSRTVQIKASYRSNGWSTLFFFLKK